MFSTQVFKCDPLTVFFREGSDVPQFNSEDSRTALMQAAHSLTDEQVVVFPTETVYGLGALALNKNAVAKIFSTKGRPADNPLIVHVSSFSMLYSLLPPDFAIPESYKHLMKHFWPGPLTLLFPSDPQIIPSIVTANHSTVAIRMPSHPVARALIALTNAPLAAPSANSSGKPSPTKADHVYRDLQGKVGLVIDGGFCGVGLESTVVDGLQEDGDIRVLRPGGVTVEDLERTLELEYTTSPIPKVLVHRRDFRNEEMELHPTTPGMKYRHYSPSVPVTLLLTVSSPPNGIERIDFKTFVARTKHSRIGLMCPSDSALSQRDLSDIKNVEWVTFPLGSLEKPSITAQRLFDGLLTLERQKVDIILIEEIKEVDEGLAVMNRVRKAAGQTTWISV